MPVSIVEISPVVLFKSSRILRDPPRPESLRQPDYNDNFDFHTVFYDVFWDQDCIVLSGPPLFNLKQHIAQAAVSLGGCPINNTNIILEDIDRTQRSYIKVLERAASGNLRFSCVICDTDTTVQPSLVNQLSGKNVLVTKSKNNNINWIQDWIHFYQIIHQVDAVVLYDNNSDDYTIEDLCDQLGVIKNVDIYLVPWNFPFGPQGGIEAGKKRLPWDSDFCQYGIMEHAKLRLLQKANLVINVDIDELLICKDTLPVMRLMEALRKSFLTFKGRWIEPIHNVSHVDENIPRFTDYSCYFRKRDKAERKWVIKPGCHDVKTMQWRIHDITSLSNKSCKDLMHRHFVAINSNWKYDRSNTVVLIDRLQTDQQLIDAYAIAWPAVNASQQDDVSVYHQIIDEQGIRQEFAGWLRRKVLYKKNTIAYELDIAGCLLGVHVTFFRAENHYRISMAAHNVSSGVAIETLIQQLNIFYEKETEQNYVVSKKEVTTFQELVFDVRMWCRLSIGMLPMVMDQNVADWGSR